MKVRINTEVLEMLLFFWQSTSEKEKVSDAYLVEIGARPEMKILYNEEFNSESVRKVLSAITNREILSEKTKEEGRFWNNNMWMLEDLSLTHEMLKPIKQLNPDIFESLATKETTVVFIPGTFETVLKDDEHLYINFFKVEVNPYSDDPKPLIDGLELETFIKNELSK